MIVGDWGTSQLRLFRLEDGRVVDRLHGPGVGVLATSAARTLLDTLQPWAADASGDTVTLCGMAGSTLGLVAAPYLACPTLLAELSRATVTVDVGDFHARIVPGLSGRNFNGDPDVMRGEETQILGALQLAPDLAHGEHLVVHPGTHGKWAHLRDGSVERFQTYFTGELFAHLRACTTLLPGDDKVEADPEGYRAGLERADTAEPLSALFTARAAQLIDGRSRAWATGFISGLLIGGEVREALRLTEPAAEEITVLGEPALWALYKAAFDRRGRKTRWLSGDDCVLAGLKAITRAEDRA